jgi:hypothetical protein
MPDWSIMFDDESHLVDADELRQQALAQHRADLQLKRQQAQEQKLKERLDYALLCIRDHGGSISRKQLTEILIKKFELARQTVSAYISQCIKDKTLFEVNGFIHASEDTALAF